MGQRLQEGAETNWLGKRPLRDGAENELSGNRRRLREVSETNCLGKRQQATAARGRENEAREEKLNPIKKKRTLKTFVKKRLGQALPCLRN